MHFNPIIVWSNTYCDSITFNFIMISLKCRHLNVQQQCPQIYISIQELSKAFNVAIRSTEFYNNGENRVSCITN